MRLVWRSMLVLCMTTAVGACSGGDSGGVTATPDALTAPTGVAVTLVSLSSVRVDWVANPSSQQVRGYNVFRDGQQIAEVTLPTYLDTGLVELSTHSYRVSAIGPGSAVSPQSADLPAAHFIVPDLTPPKVVSSVPQSGATVVSIRVAPTIQFSEALDPATVSSATIKLSTVSGIAVAGTVAFGVNATTVVFTPAAPLAPSTSYVLTASTGVKDLSGNQLLPSFTTSFTTSQPIDETPPAIVGVTPANLSRDVPVNSAVTVSFSEALDAQSITSATLTLSRLGAAAPVTATVSYNAITHVATLAPLEPLLSSTSYVVSVGTGVKDVVGNALSTPFSSQFTTAAPVDNNPPTVAGFEPADGAVNIAALVIVRVTFSEAMLASSLNATTVTLTNTIGGAAVAASIAYDVATNRLSITPITALALGTGYTVTVTTGAKDVAGNGLAANFVTRFTTIAPDITPPTIISTSPANAATDVPVSAQYSVKFSEPMLASSINATTVTLKRSAGGVAVSGTVQYNAQSREATFLPDVPLAYSTSYTATVTVGVRDVAGNALVSPLVTTYTTVAQPPIVTGISPGSRSTNISATAKVVVTFSVPVKAVSVNSSNFFVRNTATAEVVAGSIVYDAVARTATFTPSSRYENNNSYAVIVTQGVTDLAEQPLVQSFQSCFTPGPGTGPVSSVTGFWSASTACNDTHWHMTLVQTGNTISLATSCDPGDCQIAALDEVGFTALGGRGISTITSVTGTVNGTAVSLTIRTADNLTFSFVGAFATVTNSPNAWIIGSIGGGALISGGISFERQR